MANCGKIKSCEEAAVGYAATVEKLGPTNRKPTAAKGVLLESVREPVSTEVRNAGKKSAIKRVTCWYGPICTTAGAVTGVPSSRRIIVVMEFTIGDGFTSAIPSCRSRSGRNSIKSEADVVAPAGAT